MDYKKIKNKKNKKKQAESLFLVVYNTIRIIYLLNTCIALRCPNYWFLVAVDDLIREAFKMRRGNFLSVIS